MNAKTERQIESMKNQTIGVEVEMNSIRRSAAARIAAEFFGTGRYEDTARRNGCYSWSAWDSQGREWKFQRDSSIQGPDIEKCEMVTPILISEDSLKKAVAKYGEMVYNTLDYTLLWIKRKNVILRNGR